MPIIVGGTTTLCTLTQVKQQLNKTSSADDTELQDYIDSVTVPIENLCGAIISRTVTNEKHSDCSSKVFPFERVASVTSLTEYQGTTAVSYTQISSPAAAGAYTFEVATDPIMGLYMLTRIGSSGCEQAFTGPVYLTYAAGFAAVPDPVDLAARLVVQALWETQRGTQPLSPLNPEVVGRVIVETLESPRIQLLLRPYLRLPGVG